MSKDEELHDLLHGPIRQHINARHARRAAWAEATAARFAKETTMPNWFPYPIRYIGDCGISGRGYSMRGNLAALHELGITREQIDIVAWPPAMYLMEDWFYERFLCGRQKPEFPDARRVNIIDARLTDVCRFWTTGWYNVVIAACAVDRLPEGVVQVLNGVDEIWAVSEHVVQLLHQAGVETPAHVIPTALQPELLKTPPKEVAPDIAPEMHPYVGPHEFKHTSPVYFYYIGDWNDRKSVDVLLRAYFNTGWTANDPVELILHCPPRGNGDVEARGENMRQQIASIRADNDNVDTIVRPLAKPKSYGWVCKLHQMNHVFVTATRGDSFSLPAWEAAAVGNLVVVPEDVLETPLGALTYESREELPGQFKVAFDLIRSGQLKTLHALAVRAQVSPAAVGELLRERLVEIAKALKGV